MSAPVPVESPEIIAVVTPGPPCGSWGADLAGHPREAGGGARLAVSALAARGHLLIEDVPGSARPPWRALARSMGGTFRRIQFTSDLLPSDILGVSSGSPSSAASG
jgi:hypothetical protein